VAAVIDANSTSAGLFAKVIAFSLLKHFKISTFFGI